MSDIVRQLQERVDDVDQFYGFDDEELDRAAIAEIERLRAELDRLRNPAQTNAEVDRLQIVEWSTLSSPIVREG